MKNTIVVIPSRLGAERLKGKPLMHIKGIPMIVHVLKSAIKSGVGEVYVSTPDKKILEVVHKHGGNGIITGDHPNGTSRVWEVFEKIFTLDIHAFFAIKNIFSCAYALEGVNALFAEPNIFEIG